MINRISKNDIVLFVSIFIKILLICKYLKRTKENKNVKVSNENLLNI